jgi:hypothetical protein
MLGRDARYCGAPAQPKRGKGECQRLFGGIGGYLNSIGLQCGKALNDGFGLLGATSQKQLLSDSEGATTRIFFPQLGGRRDTQWVRAKEP